MINHQKYIHLNQGFSKYNKKNESIFYSQKYQKLNPIQNGLKDSNYINDLIQQKRRKTLNDYNYWSKKNEQQNLFPQTGISHKRYLTMIQDKTRECNKYSNSYLNSQLVPYPYTYTQYEILRQKMKLKKQAEQKWLQMEISRLKKQDQLQKNYSLSRKDRNKDKNKQIAAKQKQNQIKKYQMSRNIEQLKIQSEVNKRFKLQNKSQGMKCNDYTFNCQETIKQKQFQSYLYQKGQTINQQIKQIPQKQDKYNYIQFKRNNFCQSYNQNSTFQKNTDKLMKSEIHRTLMLQKNNQFKNMHAINEDSQSKLNTSYGQKYSYLKAKQRVINNEKRISNSTFQNYNCFVRKNENPNKQISQKIKLISQFQQKERIKRFNTQESNLIFDELNQCTSQYEDQLLKYKIRKDIEKEEFKNKSPGILKDDQLSFQIENLDRKNLSDIKHERRYEQLLRNLQRRQQKQKSRRKKPYSRFLIFNSDDKKQQISSIKKSSGKFKQAIKQKILTNQSQIEQMQIFKSEEQHYSTFSPYRTHKHLPIMNDNYLHSSADNKKITKHYRALQDKNQNHLPNHVNLKSLIVDEIQKKKLLLRNQPLNTNSNKSNLLNREGNQNVQLMNKNLKVELQILKQQLEQKNEKVVNLEVELIHLKNGWNIQKNFEMQHFSTAQYIDQKFSQKELRQSRNERQKKNQSISNSMIFSNSQKQCQTSQCGQNLKLQHINISHIILPNKEKQKQRNQLQMRTKNRIKKLEQKLQVQEEAILNFFQDLQSYQKENEQLKQKIKNLQNKE